MRKTTKKPLTKEQLEARASLEAYWAGSITASIANSVRRGEVLTIVAGKE